MLDVRRSAQLATAGVVAAVALTLSTGSALAATITVTNANDSGSGSLRAAIASSSSGDTIEFDSSLSGDTITLTTGELAVDHTLTITGLGASNLSVSGNGASRVFDIDAPAGTVTITGLTIEGGSAPSGSSVDGDGGGILVKAGAFNLTDSTVSGNVTTGQEIVASGSTSGSGGGIATESPDTTTLTDVQVSGNATPADSTCGGVAAEYTGALVITDSKINGNSSGFGGGVCTEGGGNATITGTTIIGNTAQDGSILAEGGGFVEDGGGTTTITDSVFYGNVAYGMGGGISEDGGGTITVTGSVFQGNAASSVSGTCTLPNPFYGQPCAAGSNGAGGGIVQDGGGVVAVSDSSMVGQTADEDGGAVSALAGTMSLTNTTIYGNGSNGIGGGIHAGGGFEPDTVTVASDTIDANTAAASSAGLGASSGGTIDVHDTIVANGSPANCVAQSPGTITSQGHNLDSGSSCGFTAAGDLSNTTPQFGSLQDNTGTTPPAYLPEQPSSPTVDRGDTAANCPSTDELGQHRPDLSESRCDIGAFELQDTSSGGGGGGGGGGGSTPISTTTALTASANPVQVAQTVSFTATVTPVPSGGTVDFTAGRTTIAGCAAVPVDTGSGQASCQTSFGSAGPESIQATYSGYGLDTGSQSPTLSEDVVTQGGVTPTVTTTVLETSAGLAVTGQRIRFTAAVTPVPDGGTVAFTTSVGGVLPGCGAVPVSATTGTASCVAVFARPGRFGLQAVYSGATGWATSRSAPISERVLSSLSLRRARARGRSIVIRLRCAARSGGCSAVATLIRTGTGHPIRVGGLRVTVPAGRAVTRRLTLTRAGRRLLSRLGRLPVELTVVLVEPGGRTTVASRALTVAVPPHRRLR